MPDIRVHVYTPGGEVHPIDAPSDIKTEEFIREVVQGLNLARVDADGHPVNWIIDHKESGRTLEARNTLDACGVASGHHLHMRREVIAG